MTGAKQNAVKGGSAERATLRIGRLLCSGAHRFPFGVTAIRHPVAEKIARRAIRKLHDDGVMAHLMRGALHHVFSTADGRTWLEVLIAMMKNGNSLTVEWRAGAQTVARHVTQARLPIREAMFR